MLPETIGKYEIRGRLGAGAMGQVLDAFDPVIERRAAVKLLPKPAADDAEGAENLARFKREAQAAGRLNHPNVVAVYDYGEDGTCAWIAMELVEGGTLKQVLDRGERLTAPRIQRLMEQVLAGLDYSHKRGVVHRDIKPANIMLTEDGTAKIADFGIARIENSSMTQLGTVMGTPAYMAPEQLRGEAVDSRADIWACGVLLYQLLTGEKPFDGGFSALLHKAVHTEPPPPSTLSVTAPRGMDAVVARALAKRPEDRFATAGDFADAMRAAATAPTSAADADATMVASRSLPSTPPNKPLGRKARLLIPGGAALVAAGVAAFVLLQPNPAEPPAGPVDVALAQQPVVRPGPTLPPRASELGIAPAAPTLTLTPVPAPATGAPVDASGLPVAAGPSSAPLPPVAAASAREAVAAAPASTPVPATNPPATAFPALTPTVPTPPIPRLPAASAPVLTPVVPPAPPASLPPSDQSAAVPPVATPGRSEPRDISLAPAGSMPLAPLAAQAPRPPATAIPNVSVAQPPPTNDAKAPSNPTPSAEPRQQLAMAAPPLAMAAPPRFDFRAAAAAAAAAPACGLLAASGSDTGLTLEGVVRASDADSLRRALAQRNIPPAAAELTVQTFDGPYCPALDLVRPVLAGFGAAPRAALTGRTPLRAGDLLRFEVSMPPWPGLLHVAYFMSSGEVAQLVTGAAHQAGATVRLGDPRAGFPGWEVSEPFGTDLLLAIVSDGPLFTAPRPTVEPQAAFLAALGEAIRTARQAGRRVVARPLVVETVAR